MPFRFCFKRRIIALKLDDTSAHTYITHTAMKLPRVFAFLLFVLQIGRKFFSQYYENWRIKRFFKIFF